MLTTVDAAALEHEAERPRNVDVHDVIAILLRRKMVIILSVLVALGAAAAYLRTATPVYTAKAVLQVVPSSASATTSDPDAPPTLTSNDELRIATHLELLMAPTLGRMVVDDLNLMDDPEFTPKESRPSLLVRLVGTLRGETEPVPVQVSDDDAASIKESRAIDALFSKVSVDRVGKSALIEIAATTTDPEKSVAIANTLVGSHLKRILRERVSETNRAIDSLEVRSQQLRDQALSGEMSAAAESRRQGVITGAGGLDPSLAMNSISAQLTDARAQRMAAEARFASLMQGGGSVSGPGLATSPFVGELRTQIAVVDRRIAELSAQFGPGYPELAAAQAQKAQMEARLADAMARARSEARAELDGARARERALVSELAQARERTMRTQQVSVATGDLQRSAETTRDLYLSQLSRLQELRGRQQTLRPDATLAVKALPPTSPSAPLPLRVLGGALAGGLMLGFLLAFVYEMLDNRLRTPDQIRRLTGLKTLAMVPELKPDEARTPPHQFLEDQATSAFAEEVRGLLIELTHRMPGYRGALVVTSPLPKEGKTMLAAHLAAAAATIGRSAVVVDLDLRRPALMPLMGMRIGEKDVRDCLIAEHLTDELIESSLLHPEGASRLAVMGVASACRDPGALLASPRLAALVEALKRRFDLVVLNAPPILAVRDAKMLAQAADATLLVARWSRTPPSALRIASQILDGLVTAAAINMVDYKKHAAGHYGDQLQHYESYSSYFGVMKPAE